MKPRIKVVQNTNPRIWACEGDVGHYRITAMDRNFAAAYQKYQATMNKTIKEDRK